MTGPRKSIAASHVFLLRVWQEGDWRGRLSDLLSGEASNFDCWAELIAALIEALQLEEGGPTQETWRVQDEHASPSSSE